MRLISLNHTLVGTNQELVLYPNGAIVGNDVVMGTGQLHRIVVGATPGASAPQLEITVFEAAVGTIGRALRGGAATPGSYKVTNGAVPALTSQKEPFVVAAPHAELLTCRKVIDTYNVNFAAGPAQFELPFRDITFVMGMAIHLDIAGAASDTVNITAEFTPDISGHTRANRVNLAQPIGGSIPL
tara:strand:+ start:42249 stop:42803 length:555 start_codon:yes stop_codon:yes gene_type:complete